MAADALFQVAHENWQWEPLAEVCRRGGGGIQTGPFGSQLHASDYVAVGVPSIMPRNIAHDRVDVEGIARITPREAERLSRYLVRPGDIVYSRRGDVERRALITERERGWLCGTGCLRVRLGEGIVDPAYASYYLSHPASRKWVVRHAVGATMPNLNSSILGALPFLLPPIPEQRAIADTLGALDDKIELNRRTACALDRLAYSIFRAWFVGFEPVKAKAAFAASFPTMPQSVFDALPTRFVDSDIGPVPEGWDVGGIPNMANVSKAQVKPQEHLSDAFEHFSIPAFDAGRRAVVEFGEAIRSSKFLVPEGCILLSRLNPRIPRVWLPPAPRGRQQIASTEFLVFVARATADRHYLYCQFQQSTFREELAQSASGTSNSHQRVRPNDVLHKRIIVPPFAVRRGFADVADPLLALSAANHAESAMLTKVRDYLLPKLLTGEVRLKDGHD